MKNNQRSENEDFLSRLKIGDRAVFRALYQSVFSPLFQFDYSK